GDTHFVERRAHCRERAPHLRLAEAADTAHAEAVRNRELAGIDDVAAPLKRLVERVEIESRIARRAYGDDDGRLQMIREQRDESEIAKPVDQDSAVLRIARAASRDPTLGGKAIERVIESGQHVSGRREAPLAR